MQLWTGKANMKYKYKYEVRIRLDLFGVYRPLKNE